MTDLTNNITPLRTVAELKETGQYPALVTAVESVKDATEAIKDEVALQFIDFYARIEAYTAKAFTLVVSNETETGKMYEALQAAKAIKALEKAITDFHKEKKEDSLKVGQAYDAVKRGAFALTQPAYEHLKAQAEYAERMEVVRVEALRVERYALILPYLVPEICPPPWPEWGAMHVDDFNATLYAAQEKARQIEADKLAQIEREKAEREELERLRVEQVEREAILEQALAAQRKVEQELAEAQKTIAHVYKDYGKPVDQILAEINENKTTDREKLRAYGAALLQVQCAPIQDQAMRKVLEQVKILLVKVDKFIEEKTAQ